MVNVCYLTGLFDNSCLAAHPKDEVLWIVFIQLNEYYSVVVVWPHAKMHLDTCSHAHAQTQTSKSSHHSFFSRGKGREECRRWRSGEGLMGSREVQERWLKTPATDVSGTLQSGERASASAGHDALLRRCPPGTWHWHHMPAPPGSMQSRGSHCGSHLPTRIRLPVWFVESGNNTHTVNTDLKGTKLGRVQPVNSVNEEWGHGETFWRRHCDVSIWFLATSFMP